MLKRASLDWLTARPIAHRGLHDKTKGVIENTGSAATAAIEAGFAIECDVQLTADGEAVVFHDFTLDRLTEARGRLDAMNAASLAKIAMRDRPRRQPVERSPLQHGLDTLLRAALRRARRPPRPRPRN